MEDQPKLSDTVVAVIRSGQELSNWIARNQNEMNVGGGRVKHVPAAVLGLAIEHQMAIQDLVARQHLGSAFALVRPQFEALVRGIWLDLCATEDELKEGRQGFM